MAQENSHTLLSHSNDATEIETRITEDSLSKCNLQSNSPFFTTLPAELRNYVFELATAPYDDPKHPYNPTYYCYRPGHHAKHKISTALLSTCRLIWLETNHLPLQQASPTFWFQAEDRRPQWTQHVRVSTGRYSLRQPRKAWITENERFRKFTSSLTAKNRGNLRELRFLGQLCWLENNQLSHLLTRGEFLPPRTVVTVRHTDWWWWESGATLAMCPAWIVSLLENWRVMRGVREVVLELETVEGKLEELRSVVEVIRTFSEGVPELLEPIEGWELTERAEREMMCWSGPTNVGGRDWEPYKNMKELKYKVFRLVWKRKEEDVGIS